MAVVSLPLTFNNSFWTQDYRKGLEVLYGKLEQVRMHFLDTASSYQSLGRASQKMKRLSLLSQ